MLLAAACMLNTHWHDAWLTPLQRPLSRLAPRYDAVYVWNSAFSNIVTWMDPGRPPGFRATSGVVHSRAAAAHGPRQRPPSAPLGQRYVLRRSHISAGCRLGRTPQRAPGSPAYRPGSSCWMTWASSPPSLLACTEGRATWTPPGCTPASNPPPPAPAPAPRGQQLLQRYQGAQCSLLHNDRPTAV
jgi:hypothetical protein